MFKTVSTPKKEILSAMESNFAFHMLYFADLPPFKRVPIEGVTAIQSDIADDTYNYVLSAQLKKAEATIEKIIAFYQEKRLPLAWWISPSDEPKNLGLLLTSKGFSLREENVGMYRFLEDFHPSDNPSSLRFEKVEDRHRLKDFAKVIESFGIPEESYEKLYSLIPLASISKDAPLEIYLGLVGNQPVVSGIVVFHAGVAGIYYLATLPEKQKKGYASALLEHLLMRAKENGYSLATLQASRAGIGLYQRLGFNACCTFPEYTLSVS